ncbi:NADPH:quinone oxidoreductase family protein [Lutimaribacter sp. EGI FJ00015]|uniref:NADPH:quinone oxidoreductase family protein n=1 Tax=Lutimaribacter degradans TaxID=2945989 RepID=A0ACC5ZW64_9RHOB|nr:NADPH:quinone oxidoreductase family protein [Lutimaribacter sp. EGI FJ00013]MCM2562532.1 NADPH:quinone oxidoreductase family protein [Lutimaribacter sp. EGI FJ00013]MCO0613689.1 NADPH:quinone oxidoreductase family protein [Lutimaribacter sp. EGI FJ00015]MCO0636828.1 NADPH:quinone oxidoreductase family protein [Lutimaribacter sp. EGI FJ00014]
MKAIICNDFASLDQLEYGDMPDPQASGDQVVIRVEAAGVNYPDGLLVQGKYQSRPDRPFVPGMEAAGVVEAVGPDVTGFKPGDRVATICTLGGYAEKVAAPAARVIPIGDMDAADVCALLVAFGTSHHALKQRAQLKAGETLVVLGAAGATGIAAIQIAKIMGARVIAVASTEEKRAICTENGADEVIGYDDLKDQIKALTDGKGADVVYDPVGGAAFDACSRAMARGGRLLVIGFASGEIPKLPVNLALVKEYAVVGVFWGNFTRFEPQVYAGNMAELLGWYQKGHVKPMIEGRYPLKDAAEVLSRVLGRGAVGKLVLVP